MPVVPDYATAPTWPSPSSWKSGSHVGHTFIIARNSEVKDQNFIIETCIASVGPSSGTSTVDLFKLNMLSIFLAF